MVWSYVGNLNYYSAKEECKKIEGGRLPSSDELLKLKIPEDWKNDFGKPFYWTSDNAKDNINNAIVLNIENGELNEINQLYYEATRCFGNVFKEYDPKTSKIEPLPEKKNVSWSDIQDRMKWDEAMKHCSTIGGRLPNRQELLAVSKSDLKQKWIEYGNNYWTIERPNGSDSNAYYVDINDGNVLELNTNGLEYSNVRCVLTNK
jgi:hypothetical protein